MSKKNDKIGLAALDYVYNIFRIYRLYGVEAACEEIERSGLDIGFCELMVA